MPEQPAPQHKPTAQAYRPRAVYTVSRFADELGVSERTVRRLIEHEKIRTVAISLGRIGIPAAELERIATQGIAP